MDFCDKVSSLDLCSLVHYNLEHFMLVIFIPVNSFRFLPCINDSCSSRNYLGFSRDTAYFSVSGIGMKTFLKSEVPYIVIHNWLNTILLIAVRMCFILDSSCIHTTCLKKEELFPSTSTSWIALLSLLLIPHDLSISLIPSFILPAC